MVLVNSGNAQNWRLRWRLRWIARTVMTATVATGMLGAAVSPAHATTPKPPSPGPEPGALPTPTTDLPFPLGVSLPQPNASDIIGPLAAEIIAESVATERLGEDVKSITDEEAAALQLTLPVRIAWQTAKTNLDAVRAEAARVATEAYQDATKLGPFGDYTNDLHELGKLAPALPPQLPPQLQLSEQQSLAADLAAAETAEQDARVAMEAAIAAEQEIAGRKEVLTDQFARHQAALATLKKRNAAILGTAESARDTYEESLTAGRGLGTSVNGWRAAPAAVNAVRYALRQLGKPYEWAAEGPRSFDCSGLVYAAYGSVGQRLPRVSRDQYRAGSPVLVNQLLPGDLLFFSTDRSNSRAIHHVAMYVGDGKMVHAPTFNDKVKISPIWWTEYFGATRIFPAIAGPTRPSPSPSPTHSPTPTPTPKPSPSQSPSPSPSQSPSPSPSTSPSPSPSPTSSPSPSASSSPQASPAAQPAVAGRRRRRA